MTKHHAAKLIPGMNTNTLENNKVLKVFVNNVKILAVFIFVDLLCTMLLMGATGASFVMMNSITFKLMAAAMAIVVTAVGFTVYEVRQKK